MVPFPPGGPTDTAARIIGQRMGELLKQTVLIENRGGASGSIAAAAFAKAPADGYTLMMLATPTLLAPLLYKDPGYDVQRDFAPVGSAYDVPLVMVVNPQLLPDVTDLQQFVAKAKAAGGRMNYTTPSVGSFAYVSMELLQSLGSFAMVHVPYRGSAAAISDLLGGQVPMMFADTIVALPHIQSGKLRAIAVGSPNRISFTPEVKTVAEQGYPGFDAVSWGGLLAPLGTPADVIARLSGTLKTALADTTVQTKLLAVGSYAAYQPPQAMAERIRSDTPSGAR